jgi:hypothetical protein
MSRAESRMGMTCAIHRRFGFGIAHRKGTNLWFAFRIDTGHGSE